MNRILFLILTCILLNSCVAYNVRRGIMKITKPFGKDLTINDKFEYDTDGKLIYSYSHRRLKTNDLLAWIGLHWDYKKEKRYDYLDSLTFIRTTKIFSFGWSAHAPRYIKSKTIELNNSNNKRRIYSKSKHRQVGKRWKSKTKERDPNGNLVKNKWFRHNPTFFR